MGAFETTDAATLPLPIPQGRTLRRRFWLRVDPDDPATAISLTGLSGRAQVRAFASSDVVMLELTVDVNQAIEGAAGCGEVVIEATALATGSVGGDGVWALDLIEVGTDPPVVWPVMEGPAPLKRDVVR